MHVRLALLICTLSLSAGPAAAGDLHLLGGKVVAGDLQSVSADKVVFTTLSGPVTARVGEVLRVELQPVGTIASGTKYSDIELTDGSVLHCTRYTLKGTQVEATLAGSDQKVTFPLAAVLYLLNQADDPAVRQEWQDKVLSKHRTQDTLAVRVNGVVNPVEGTLGEANDKGEIRFEYEIRGAKKTITRDASRALGLAFVRTSLPQIPANACRLQDVFQNLFIAGRLELRGDMFTVLTPAGAQVEFPKKAVARLDYTNDKVVSLSDLKPVETVEKSRQGRKDNVHVDKNLDNGPLQLKGVIYARGLALHAHTELAYALDGKYKKFDALVGMDESVGGDGAPVVRVEGDGRELFSRTVTRADGAVPVSLDVKGVRQLRIIVTSHGAFDFGDHVDLADAKLSK